MTYRRPSPDALREEYHRDLCREYSSWLPAAALVIGCVLWGLLIGAAFVVWLT